MSDNEPPAAGIGSLYSPPSGATLLQARQHLFTVMLGGPGTRLPRFVESTLSWSLCVSCLGVSGYHYLRTTVVVPALSFVRAQVRRLIALPVQLITSSLQPRQQDVTPYESVWVPLTTHSRSELEKATPRQRCDQLVQLLGKLLYVINDDGIVVTLRRNRVARRLASLTMRPYCKADADGTTTTTSSSAKMTTLLREHPELEVVQSLARVWPQLVQLPPLRDTYEYDLSLVLPAFREDGKEICRKLTFARDSCVDCSRVEIILVDAGGCQNLDAVLETSPTGGQDGHDNKEEKLWGCIKMVTFTGGGGRGPCLNFGAANAVGRILTFCHSDTRLPMEWDRSIVKAFHEEDEGRGTKNKKATVRSNSCAFAFGIDTSSAGLNGGPCPPGIKAVETTANLRTHLYSLPYGDQCLSVPSDVFHYVGGFPDQCLMEDYELVALLRKRSALLPKLGVAQRERLQIIGGPAALCSPRRWQKFGVLYVTWMNSKFVNLYAGGLHPDDLFRLYYGAPPPAREQEMSPWEVELQELLAK